MLKRLNEKIFSIFLSLNSFINQKQTLQLFIIAGRSDQILNLSGNNVTL